MCDLHGSPPSVGVVSGRGPDLHDIPDQEDPLRGDVGVTQVLAVSDGYRIRRENVTAGESYVISAEAK